MYDEYSGYLTNMKNGGVLTQDQESGTVFLADQLSYTEPDPSQQWTLDYYGEMRLNLSEPPAPFVFQWRMCCSLRRAASRTWEGT